MITSTKAFEMAIDGNFLSTDEKDGEIFAGFSRIEGKDFHFQYEPYHIVLDSVRYFDLFVPTGEIKSLCARCMCPCTTQPANFCACLAALCLAALMPCVK